MFEWYMVRDVLRMDTRKDMCLKETGRRVQNTMTILNSIVEINKGTTYMTT